MKRLYREIQAKVAERYLLDMREHHLAHFPQMVGLSFDLIPLTINVRGRYDAERLDFLLSHLADHIRGRTVCDIGANIGNHSVAFASAADRVIALEPHPRTFELLSLNCRSFANIVPLPLAASDRRGRVEMAARAISLGNNMVIDGAVKPGFDERSQADALPLDALELLADADVGLIKIDVEGHEAHVLRGASALLAAKRPIVVLEQWADAISDGTSPSLDLLRGLGYRYFHVLDVGLEWRTPSRIWKPIRSLMRAIEALVWGLPRRSARACAIQSLEARNYPCIIASVDPISLSAQAVRNGRGAADHIWVDGMATSALVSLLRGVRCQPAVLQPQHGVACFQSGRPVRHADNGSRSLDTAEHLDD